MQFSQLFAQNRFLFMIETIETWAQQNFAPNSFALFLQNEILLRIQLYTYYIIYYIAYSNYNLYKNEFLQSETNFLLLWSHTSMSLN